MCLEQFNNLSPLAHLNVWADHLAKQELHRIALLPSHPVLPNLLLGETWAAYLLSGKITSDPQIPIHDHLGWQAAKQYWAHKQQLDDHSFSLVHWEILEKALAGFPPTFQMWLSKFASGHVAVATTMMRWKRWDLNLCPLCHTAPETTQHILCCQSDHCSWTWSQQLQHIHQWLSLSDTAPEIQSYILSILENCQQPSFQSSASLICYPAAMDQNHISFFGFMVGHLASSWQSTQANYYSSSRSKCSVQLWQVRLCHQVLQFTHKIWLARNHQLTLNQQQQASTQSATDIVDQFHQGTTDLLPEDHFYISQGSQGFSLAQVLDMSFKDQQLWLHAIRNTRLQGQEVLPLPHTE